MEIATPHGPARILWHPAQDPRALLLLGHGAGGGFGAMDLVTVTALAGSLGVTVAQVEQPYRVAGRRNAAPAAQLDAAWLAVASAMQDDHGALPLLVGGRSSGARVACRTASAVGATGVLCLAFPLHPPGRPEKSRLAELEGVPSDLPVLVVQGAKDPFGMPPPADGREVAVVAGTHALRAAGPVREAVEPWLRARLA